MATERHCMVQNAADHFTVLCGDIRIADIHQDATGKHFTRIADVSINLEPTDLAFILSTVLHLDTRSYTVQ